MQTASLQAAVAQRPDTVARQPADTPVVAISEVRVEVSRLSAGGIDLLRAPFFVSTLSREGIRATGSLSAADALVRLPGVHANDELGAAAQTDLTLRGFTVSPVVGLPQSLSVFVDGVRVNEPDAAQVNFDLIPLRDIERIDVIRGPVGPFGRNTLAGALNIVTRRGEAEPQAEIELVGGSFGAFEASGRAGGTLGSYDLYGSARYLRSDGWRDVTGTRFIQLFTKMGRRTERSDLWLAYTFANDSIEQAGSLPSSWLGGSLPPELAGTSDPRKLNFTGGDFFLPQLHSITGSYAYQLTSQLDLRANAFYRRNEVEQFNANITEANTRVLSDLWSAGFTGQLGYRPQPDLLLLGGVEYVRDDVEIRIRTEPNAAVADSGLITHVTTQQDAYAVFSQLWWSPRKRLSLLGSVRYDQMRVPFRDLLDPANNGTNTFRQVTANLGADYLVSPAASIYASYGHGFRAPVILELACADPEDPCPLPFELGADPPLDPVTIDTWQIGARLMPTATLSLEASAYWSEVQDEIFNVVAPPTTRGFFQNVDRTRRQGVDLQAELRPLPQFRLFGDLSFTRATFQSRATLAAAFLEEEEGAGGAEGAGGGGAPEPPQVEPGDRFPLVPDWRANLGASYRAAGWWLGLDGSYVGSQWLRSDEDNTRTADKLDPRFLLDAQVERAIGPATLYLRVDNLLDTSYRTFGVIANNPLSPAAETVEPFYTPGLPRRVLAGARWRW